MKKTIADSMALKALKEIILESEITLTPKMRKSIKGKRKAETILNGLSSSTLRDKYELIWKILKRSHTLAAKRKK